MQIYRIPLSGGCTVFWFHPPPFPLPWTVSTSCTKPHILIWQTKHQEWGNQTAQEILQANSLDKYFQLTLQQGPSSLWSWLCNQKPRCLLGRFCVVVLCCMQSDGRGVGPGERMWCEDHKTGMCVCVSGLALTFSGCHLSRQGNGIQVSCSSGHLWKCRYYPGAMTQRCPHCFLLWADCLPQPSLSGTVLCSFSMDNTGIRPSVRLTISLKPFVYQNCSWRQVKPSQDIAPLNQH